MNNYRIIHPNELNHHGVKGMKWGVRKERPAAMSGSIITKRQKVKAYSRAYDKASSSQDRADDKWREVKSAHKKLGKTIFGRARSVAKAQKGQGSSAAKDYLKKYGEWEALQEKADSATEEMRKSRESLGSNWVSRTFRTIKYR